MVVGTLGVVAVIVEGGVWILGSTIWLRHPRRMEKGKKRGSKATMSTHPNYSASKDLHYICNIYQRKVVYVDWAAEMPE